MITLALSSDYTARDNVKISPLSGPGPNTVMVWHFRGPLSWGSVTTRADQKVPPVYLSIIPNCAVYE